MARFEKHDDGWHLWVSSPEEMLAAEEFEAQIRADVRREVIAEIRAEAKRLDCLELHSLAYHFKSAAEWLEGRSDG
jgi:hypothetical protein